MHGGKWITCVLALVTVVLLTAPVSAKVAPVVTYYGDNTADGFVRSFKVTNIEGDGYGIHQSGSFKGAVVMSAFADGAGQETSAGFVIVVGWASLGHLRSITVAPSDLTLTGSAKFALNLWIDANTVDDTKENGPFFVWSGNTFTDLGGDVYALGPGVGAGGGTSLFVDLTTTFFVIGGTFGGQTKTVADLEAAYPEATFGVWIGIDISGGTAGSGSVTLPPVSSPAKLQIVTA